MSLSKFQIETNNHLSKQTKGVYRFRYVGMGNPENPDFINHLKNTYNNFSTYKLQSAVQQLQKTLEEDLPYIYQRLGFEALVVCVVPRAKAEKSYSSNQQLFRSTVQKVIQQISGYVDGTNYLRRHTDTKTTHLRKEIPNYTNNGPEPYPGITEETCKISTKVRDKDILLIDDIYTPNVNIDEDAINSLYNAGASTITFYSVAKV